MYTCAYDDELAEIVKQAAKREYRTTRGQFVYYLEKALESEGLLQPRDIKKADVRQDQSASV